MYAVVFANGEPPSGELARELAAKADLVVAADGGADRALALGVTPDHAVGDFDSISEEARALLGAQRLSHRPRADATDLQKAIAYAVEQGARLVDVVCAGGGRADHALANLSVLRVFRGQAVVRLVDDAFAVSLVDGRAEVAGPPGTVISLVAIGPCTGVTTLGLRWDLDEAELEFGPLGVHNEIRESPATVAVGTGDLLVFEGRWVERHR